MLPVSCLDRRPLRFAPVLRPRRVHVVVARRRSGFRHIAAQRLHVRAHPPYLPIANTPTACQHPVGATIEERRLVLARPAALDQALVHHRRSDRTTALHVTSNTIVSSLQTL